MEDEVRAAGWRGAEGKRKRDKTKKGMAKGRGGLHRIAEGHLCLSGLHEDQRLRMREGYHNEKQTTFHSIFVRGGRTSMIDFLGSRQRVHCAFGSLSHSFAHSFRGFSVLGTNRETSIVVIHFLIIFTWCHTFSASRGTEVAKSPTIVRWRVVRRLEIHRNEEN